MAEKLSQERQRQQERLHNPKGVAIAGSALTSGELEALKAQLAEKDNLIMSSDQRCSEQARKIEQLNKEMSEMEEQLNKSYNDTLDQMVRQIAELQVRLTKSNKEADLLHEETIKAQNEKGDIERKLKLLEDQFERLQAEKVEQERDAQRKICDLESRVKAQVGFVLSSANTTLSERTGTEESVHAIESEVAKLKGNLGMQEAEIETRRKLFEENGSKIKELKEQVTLVESRLAVANQVADFLKSSLSRSEDENKKNQARAAEVETQLENLKSQLQERDITIAQMEFKLSESTRITKFVQGNLSRTQDEKRQQECKAKEAMDKLESLEAELKEMEQSLHNTRFQLTGTNRVLNFVQATLDKTKKEREAVENELEGKIAEKQFKLTESTRVLGFVQSTLRKTQEEKQKLENDLEAKVASLEFRLSESNRVAKFLQSSVSRMGQEKSVVEAKVKDLEAQLATARDELKQKEESIQAGQEASLEQAQALTEMRGKIAEIESRLAVTNLVAEFLQTSLSRTEEEKRESDAKVSELTTELNSVREQLRDAEQRIYSAEFRLAGTERVLKYTENALKKTNQEKEQTENELEGIIAQKEFRLTEANRMVRFLQTNLEKTKREKDENENKLEGRIAQLEFRVSEANRVTKFLEGAVNRVQVEKRNYEVKSKELMEKVDALSSELEKRLVEIEMQGSASADQVTKINDLTSRICDVEARLSVTNRVAEFLQMTLSKTEEEKRVSDADTEQAKAELNNVEELLRQAQQQICEKDFQITGTNRVLKFVQNSLEKTKKDKETMENALEAQIAEKEFRLTETKRVLGFIQSTLQKTKLEKETNENNLEGRISQLEFRVSESNRMVRFLETKVTRSSDEKKAQDAKIQLLENELGEYKALAAARKETIEAKDKQCSEQQQQLGEMGKSVSDLESRLIVANNVNQFLQSSLTQTEEISRTRRDSADSTRLQLVALQEELKERDRKISQLEFKLTESQKLGKFLQNRAEQSEMEKRMLEAKSEQLEQQMEFLNSRVQDFKETGQGMSGVHVGL